MDIVEEMGVGLPLNATHTLLPKATGHHGNTVMSQCETGSTSGNKAVRADKELPKCLSVTGASSCSYYRKGL